MNIRELKNSWLYFAHRLRRSIGRADERLISDYFKTTSDPRLQIGGGWHRLTGWLNSDLGLVPGVMHMDATQPFPLLDETIRFVYTEHMIEHISYEEGAFMLQECFRVMKKGGTIRVTTPDCAAIAGLHEEHLSETQREYLVWFCKTFLPKDYPPRPSLVINAFFRLWGHQFIYDEETLTDSLRAAGFHSIKRVRLCDSDHPLLQNLENTTRYPEGLLAFESMALEAYK